MNEFSTFDEDPFSTKVMKKDYERYKNTKINSIYIYIYINYSLFFNAVFLQIYVANLLYDPQCIISKFCKKIYLDTHFFENK